MQEILGANAAWSNRLLPAFFTYYITYNKNVALLIKSKTQAQSYKIE